MLERPGVKNLTCFQESEVLEKIFCLLLLAERLHTWQGCNKLLCYTVKHDLKET